MVAIAASHLYSMLVSICNIDMATTGPACRQKHIDGLERWERLPTHSEQTASSLILAFSRASKKFTELVGSHTLAKSHRLESADI